MSTNFYDTAFAEYPPYAETPMKAMYEKVARLIPTKAPVIDLGCGSGYLACALEEREYEGNYLGVDFSPVAIEMAEACFQNRQLELPLCENLDDIREIPYKLVTEQFKFKLADLTTWKPPEVSSDTHKTIFTCFEVLEHLDEDKDLVAMVPARARFIFSVPNYWSRSHVRTYDSVGTAFIRFGEYLKFNAWYSMPTRQPEACIHLYDTIRRADKW